MKINDIIAQYPNFQFHGTGGGCTAWVHPLNDRGGRLMITDEDGSSAPEEDATVAMCGFYADEDDDGEVEVLPVDQVDSWIDEQLGLGEIPVQLDLFQEEQQL